MTGQANGPGRRARSAAASEGVHWLSADEERAWRVVASTIHKLRWALECQLERDSDLSFIEYHALARLSEEPDRTLRMSELAAVTNASLSRLSHLVKRLEARGYVRRHTDTDDRRCTRAVLTPAGDRKLAASAPAHVAAVRALVVDEFAAEELLHLGALLERIITRIDESSWRQELT